MDLTYMPGELDYKQEKKGNGSEIKREHDSVDDFEHLDPESSPIDGQYKTFTSTEKIEIKPESVLKIDAGKPQQLVEHVSADLASKPSQLDNTNLNSDDLLSGFSSDLKQDIDFEKGKSTVPDFDTTTLSSVPQNLDKKLKSDHLDTHFIAAEIDNNTDKTDLESCLDNNPKNNINKDEFSIVQEFNKKAEDEKFPADIDVSTSMKAHDALSQYDIKPDKKENAKKENLLDEHSSISKHDMSSGVDKTEPKSETELPKPVPEPENQEPEKSNMDSKLLKDDLKEELKEDLIGDVKPFIAICPPKPSTASKNTETITLVSDLDDIVIGPEDVFKRIGLDAWFTPERLHPKVEALVYWRDPKKSGIVFGSIMAVLLSLCYMSLISVVAYFSLLALTGTIFFRIYKNILQAVQKNDEGHPFKEFLDIELSLPQDKVREVVDTAVVHVNAGIVELRRLFLVEDLIDSIKFGVCLWCLTYVGAIFNGMTIVILSFVALFTVPKIYENNKANIDQYIEMGRSKVADITSKVKAAVPIGKKEPEKAKEQ